VDTQEIELPAVVEMDRGQRVEAQVYGALIEKISGCLKSEMTSQLGRSNSIDNGNRAAKLARLQGELAVIIDIFSQDSRYMGDGEKKKWLSLLDKALFSRAEPESVINCLGKTSHLVEEHLVGAVSLGTFAGLLRRCGCDVTVYGIVAPVRLDINGKVDIIYRLGDNDIYGNEIVRLVQLKTVGKGSDMEILPAGSEIIERGLHPKFKEGDARILLKTGNEIKTILEKKEGKKLDVKAFFVSVPSYGSEVVSNAFGIVKDTKICKDFEYNARANSLIP